MAGEGDQADGDAWGDDISEERKAWLEARLRVWKQEADHGERKGPFHSIELTGADVYWLAARTLVETDPSKDMSEAAVLLRRRSELDNSVNVNIVNLDELHLEGAQLQSANLEGANLSYAHLENSILFGAKLAKAFLFNAHLDRANLYMADLKQATLPHAYLTGASVRGAHLEDAYLSLSRLEEVDATECYLGGANLRGAWLDSKTVLRNAILDERTQLGDVHWGGVGAVDLTQIDWYRVPRLGDERAAGQSLNATNWDAIARAYRQLATQLRAQGITEVADRFAYRAQLCQQQVLRLQKRWGQWLFAGLLWLLSGYGYRLWRILAAYGSVVAAFALAYFLLGLTSSPHVTWYEALLASFTDIHGRVGVNTIFPLLSVQQWLAALESVIGIVIEGVFVAMLVQRFFASK